MPGDLVQSLAAEHRLDSQAVQFLVPAPRPLVQSCVRQVVVVEKLAIRHDGLPGLGLGPRVRAQHDARTLLLGLLAGFSQRQVARGPEALVAGLAMGFLYRRYQDPLPGDLAVTSMNRPGTPPGPESVYSIFGRPSGAKPLGNEVLSQFDTH